MVRHFQIIVSGKVENTGFRLFALRGARKLHITGEASQHSGRIIIEAEGEGHNLADYEAWCRLGPTGSLIESVEVTEIDVRGYADFKIV